MGMTISAPAARPRAAPAPLGQAHEQDSAGAQGHAQVGLEAHRFAALAGPAMRVAAAKPASARRAACSGLAGIAHTAGDACDARGGRARVSPVRTRGARARPNAVPAMRPRAVAFRSVARTLRAAGAARTARSGATVVIMAAIELGWIGRRGEEQSKMADKTEGLACSLDSDGRQHRGQCVRLMASWLLSPGGLQHPARLGQKNAGYKDGGG